jgi:hypothetical protein
MQALGAGGRQRRTLRAKFLRALGGGAVVQRCSDGPAWAAVVGGGSPAGRCGPGSTRWGLGRKNHMRAGSQARRITARRLPALHKAASRCARSMLVDALLSLNTALRSHTSAAPSTSTTHDEPTPPSPPLCTCTCTTPTELAASCAEHYYPYECGHRRSASRRLKLLPVDSALPSEDWATTASVLQHLIIAATAIVLVDRCSAWEIARCAKVMQSAHYSKITSRKKQQKPETRNHISFNIFMPQLLPPSPLCSKHDSVKHAFLLSAAASFVAVRESRVRTVIRIAQPTRPAPFDN